MLVVIYALWMEFSSCCFYCCSQLLVGFSEVMIRVNAGLSVRNRAGVYMLVQEQTRRTSTGTPYLYSAHSFLIFMDQKYVHTVHSCCIPLAYFCL